MRGGVKIIKLITVRLYEPYISELILKLENKKIPNLTDLRKEHQGLTNLIAHFLQKHFNKEIENPQQPPPFPILDMEKK